ncbi:MAG: tetratricopeptide repeat protein [Myxococcota bacterium]
MSQRRRTWFYLAALTVALAFSTTACAGKEKTDEAAVDEVKEKPTEGSEQSDEAAEEEAESGEEARSEADTSEEKQEQPKDEKVDRRTQSDIESAVAEAREGDRSDALDELEDLLNGSAGYLAAYNMAIIHESEGATKKAAQRYQQALEKNPDFSPALLNLIRLYLRNGQTSDADQIGRKYMDRRPENMSHRAAHLEVELQKGQYEEVIRSAKKILRRDEKNVDAMLAMAEANMALERFELARAILDRAAEIQPERAEIYFKYGSISDQEETPAAAIDGYKQAIDRRADYPEAHNNLGVLYHDARDYQAAIDEFSAAIKWAPTFREAYLNKGNSLKGKGEFEKAAAAFEKALEIDPNYADALFNLGILYLDSDFKGMDKIPELRKSIEYFEKYKSVKSSRIADDDPVNKYLQEAKKAIEVEKQREEMMREQQQEP